MTKAESDTQRHRKRKRWIGKRQQAATVGHTEAQVKEETDRQESRQRRSDTEKHR